MFLVRVCSSTLVELTIVLVLPLLLAAKTRSPSHLLSMSAGVGHPSPVHSRTHFRVGGPRASNCSNCFADCPTSL
eukprot:10939494-Alexandrium_andersonii.AAC.1